MLSACSDSALTLTCVYRIGQQNEKRDNMVRLQFDKCCIDYLFLNIIIILT